MDFCVSHQLNNNFKSTLYVLLSGLFLISFPAYSSTSLFTYASVNLAFVLGLSIPIIVISMIFNFKGILQLRYFVMLTISLIGLVCFSGFGVQTKASLPLIFSMLYLAFVYFSWTVNTLDSLPTVTKVSHSMVLLTSAIFIGVVNLYPNESMGVVWLFASCTVVTLIAVRIKYTTQGNLALAIYMALFFLPVVYFLIVIFLYINQSIDNKWLMLNSVACYVLFFLGSCCKIALALHTKQSNESDKLFTKQSELTQTMNDDDTNLPSQKQAYKCINKALKNNQRDTFAAIVFKPINFQQVNKVLGHKNSDILLLQLTYCLEKSVENTKNLLNFNNSQMPIRIARLRGLNFLVVLQLGGKENEADVYVENLCQELSLAVPDAMSFKSFSLNFELAFGVSYVDDYINGLPQTVAHAEDALLYAEENQVSLNFFNKNDVIYSESHLLQMERLKQDILEDNLYWYVQPQMRAQDRHLVGFELLVQWHNENDVPIDFKGFIKTAEYSGELYFLTKQMIINAFKLILKLQRASNYEKVSIKLLSEQILEPDLVSFIEQQIEKYNVPAKYLIIELPEKVFISAKERAKSIIDELKSLQVNIAISDFSGSYESLRYLRKMAIHQVKIDCELVSEAEDDPENAIISSLIGLTKKMEIPLIGTSVNNKSTEKVFIIMGGELVQGDVVDRSVTSENIGTWVKTWNDLYHPI